MTLNAILYTYVKICGSSLTDGNVSVWVKNLKWHTKQANNEQIVYRGKTLVLICSKPVVDTTWDTIWNCSFQVACAVTYSVIYYATFYLMIKTEDTDSSFVFQSVRDFFPKILPNKVSLFLHSKWLITGEYTESLWIFYKYIQWIHLQTVYMYIWYELLYLHPLKIWGGGGGIQESVACLCNSKKCFQK